MRRFTILFVLPVLAVLLWYVAPLATGERTLCLRDVFNTHLALKAYQGEALRRGEFPLIDPLRNGGQMLAGNPNALPFYPTSWLVLFGSTIWALNAHFWLHWLLAPVAFFLFARRFGLSPPAAWAGGVVYAFSGYYVSQLNMANLVAAATLAPVLAAAALRVSEPGRQRASIVALGLLWALVLVGGDPMTAGVAALAAISAALARDGRATRLGLLAGAFACGTLLAAPQLVELRRGLSFSFRGFWGYGGENTVGGWDPRLVIDWLLPFPFGRPDLGMNWGEFLLDNGKVLFFSLFPGTLTLVLVAAGGLARRRAVIWSWGAIGSGLAVATAAVNPLTRWLFALPGASLLRYPVKVWLLVALGASLLAAHGAERLLKAEGRGAAARAIAVLAILYAGLWGTLTFAAADVPRWIARISGEKLHGSLVEAERLRFAGLALIGLLSVALVAGGLAAMRRAQQPALAALLLAHVGLQLLLLAPVLPTDESAFYQRAPAMLELVPADAVVFQGDWEGAVSPPELARSTLPGRVARGLARFLYSSLAPWSGELAGRRYELCPSTEGLDLFMAHVVAKSLKQFDGRRRVQLLRAFGVDHFILDRELEAEAALQVELVGEREVYGLRHRVYRLRETMPEVVFAGEVVRAPHMNAALDAVFRRDFDPRRTAILAGEGPMRTGAGGTATLVRNAAEELEVEVDAASAGVLMIRRSFLPIWRASVDGAAAQPTFANLARLALELPAGRHRVRFWIDRRPFHAALGVALGGLIALLALARLARPGGIIPPVQAPSSTS